MSKHIVIVESPAKSKTIEKFLGKDYTVLASFGHVRDLPSKNGSVDVDNNFDMKYVVPKESEKAIKAIVSAVKKAETVFLATDLDREGEAISWHVLEELKARIKDFDKKHVVKRIAFSEITKKALQHAVANPRELAMPLIDAQQARRALDYLVGFNLSPVLWRKVRPGLSAGRVQSVALRLICEREDAIEAFNPEEYWTIAADFNTPEGRKLTTRLTHLDGTKLSKFSLNSDKSADEAVKMLEGKDYTISEVKKKQVKRNPSPPFITSTLQMEASRKLGYGARKTMQVAQRLYEAGLITYMRTDSVNLSNEALDGVRTAIKQTYGAEYVPEKPNFYKTKTQNAQEAHEAIRPTSFENPPASMNLEPDHIKLYTLIWKRTVASQMTQAKLDQTTLRIQDASGKHEFRASGSIIAFHGFLKVYHEGLDDGAKDDTDESLLPNVNADDAMDLITINPDQHFTEPPPRFSEATLVKSLEEHGIGRPSTYASIVSTIRDRGYVRIEAKRFHPEDVGRIVSKFLVEHFARYVDLGFTAEMEAELDAVSRGEKEWKPMLAEFWTPFKKQVDDKIESVKKSDVTSEKTGEACPKCKKGELIIRLGRFGRFKGCSAYPECKHIENLDGSTTEKAEPKTTGVKCPKCKKDDILERTSRRGKVFYGCGGYPKCKYALWDKPIEEHCPKCDWPIVTERETKRFGLVRKCGSDACEWQDPPAKKADPKKAAAKKKAPAKKKAVAKKAAPKKKAAAKKAPAKKKTVKKKAS